MPGVNGLEAIARIRALSSPPAILVLSMHDEAQMAARALKVGAAGYATKDSDPALLLTAIRKERVPADGKPDFKRAVAFYPACRVQSESPSFSARLPLLILMGDADDWTPAAPCGYLAKAAQARGEQVGIVLYPGAHHDFDHPRLEVKERENIAYSASGTGKVTVGTNMAAREDALKRVNSFLATP